jgi:hypothetical protein
VPVVLPVVVLVLTALLTTASGRVVPLDGAAPGALVTPAGIRVHLSALRDIARANQGNRSAGTSGFDASVGYVGDRLRAAGYQVTVQHFPVPYFAESTPPVLARVGGPAYAPTADARTLTFSGSGDVTAQVVPIRLTLPPTPAPSSTSGCSPGQFAGFPPGAVALVQRGGCSFADKARVARSRGAAALLVMNEGQPGRTEPVDGTLQGPDPALPVLGVSYRVGLELAGAAGAPPATVHLATRTVAEMRDAANVLADSPLGRPDRLVMVGAHLDSVPKGPGINDDGSGTATVLAIAEQLTARHLTPRNRVRFAFWGAEELGLLGSKHYVAALPPEGRREIAAYLNFDMLGSPNYARFVQSGDGPPGTAALGARFTRYFAGRNLPAETIGFDGRSDYAPFAKAGVPVGGVFSGAEEVKTAEQAKRFGGTAGQPFDRCYHSACDTLANVDDRALDELGGAAAQVVLDLLDTPDDPRTAR